MSELLKHPLYKVGDQVRIKLQSRWIGTITEARGTFRENGHVLYRVHVPLDPEPLWMELRENEIEKV